MTLQKLVNKNNKRSIGFIIILVAVTGLLLANFTKLAAFNNKKMVGKSLPEFTHSDKQDWINSQPLSRQDLEGKVVLIDFWTFGCWNCYRSFPWLNSLEKKLKGQDFVIIGVHTPEFEHEKNRTTIAQKTKEFNLHHPVMIDSDFSYWKTMNNRYWPTFYLIDKNGKIDNVFIGETHEGDIRARVIERNISNLLKS